MFFTDEENLKKFIEDTIAFSETQIKFAQECIAMYQDPMWRDCTGLEESIKASVDAIQFHRQLIAKWKRDFLLCGRPKLTVIKGGLET